MSFGEDISNLISRRDNYKLSSAFVIEPGFSRRVVTDGPFGILEATTLIVTKPYCLTMLANTGGIVQEKVTREFAVVTENCRRVRLLRLMLLYW